jgi:hypothetical protein
MTTRVTSNGPSTAVVATSTASRTTPAVTRPFNQVMGASASAVVAGAEAAVRGLPGGPLLAAAMRPAGSGAVTSEAGDLRAEGSAGTAAAFGADANIGSGGTASSGVEATLASSADQNMYYLQLQERISAESRAYSALSNVLKARHDTIKNAIGNIR